MARRYSETILVCRPNIVTDDTGGQSETGTPITLQSVLAKVTDQVRARGENMDTMLQIVNAVSFVFYKNSNYEISPDVFILWRGKRMTIRSTRFLNDAKRIEIVCTYGEKS